MFKKLSVIAFLALIIIPAGVFAAGTQAQGAGSGTMAADGQQSGQQSDGTQVQEQYSYCNQIGFETNADTGNGTLTRTRTCEQIQLRTFAQLQTQTQNQSQIQDQLQTMTQNQLRTQIRDQLRTMTMTQDKLRTMTQNQSRLKDGSCGNCPRLTAVAV
jgi:hypothetical protein